MRKCRLVLVALATLAACGQSPSSPVEPAGLAIVGAQLIDGTGADPVADSVILIRDDRIVAAGPRETTEIPEGAEVVDAAGKTIIPGLADMHAHYGGDRAAAEEMLRTQLYYGVTTARSIGTDNADQVALLLEANARGRRWSRRTTSRSAPVGEAEFGTLEAGKIADLVVLDADPLEDIRNTLAIDRVMRAASGWNGRGCCRCGSRPYAGG